jgi:hypothetical protein
MISFNWDGDIILLPVTRAVLFVTTAFFELSVGKTDALLCTVDFPMWDKSESLNDFGGYVSWSGYTDLPAKQPCKNTTTIIVVTRWTRFHKILHSTTSPHGVGA